MDWSIQLWCRQMVRHDASMHIPIEFRLHTTTSISAGIPDVYKSGSTTRSADNIITQLQVQARQQESRKITELEHADYGTMWIFKQRQCYSIICMFSSKIYKTLLQYVKHTLVQLSTLYGQLHSQVMWGHRGKHTVHSMAMGGYVAWMHHSPDTTDGRARPLCHSATPLLRLLFAQSSE